MSKKKEQEIVIDVWGKIACFTHPACKVERMTYPIMTPSAARGILCSIYMKPVEFYYQIERIDVINDINYINVMKNELKEKVNYNKPEVIYTTSESREKGRTQRNTYYLKDVYYRIYAKMIKQDDCNIPIEAMYEQFKRRVEKGQCFRQPYLGTKECVCHFSMPNWEKRPNEKVNINIKPMLYDVFNIKKNEIFDGRKKNQNVIKISFFDARVVGGVCIVPEFTSSEVRRVVNA